jgi:hypothetical protein
VGNIRERGRTQYVTVGGLLWTQCCGGKRGKVWEKRNDTEKYNGYENIVGGVMNLLCGKI